jgi:hypothetical protein
MKSEMSRALGDGGRVAPDRARRPDEKYALNNWLRQAGPTFDASLAMEFLGFDSPEIKEGLASHLEKRAPSFPSKSPF